jgi:hypothetical protein
MKTSPYYIFDVLIWSTCDKMAGSLKTLPSKFEDKNTKK